MIDLVNNVSAIIFLSLAEENHDSHLCDRSHRDTGGRVAGNVCVTLTLAAACVIGRFLCFCGQSPGGAPQAPQSSASPSCDCHFSVYIFLITIFHVSSQDYFENFFHAEYYIHRLNSNQTTAYGANLSVACVNVSDSDVNVSRN